MKMHLNPIQARVEEKIENRLMERQEMYLQLLSMAGDPGGGWLCGGAEEEGTCPRCGEKAVESGEVVIMDWEGKGVNSARYASYCGCGQNWVEEAEAAPMASDSNAV